MARYINHETNGSYRQVGTGLPKIPTSGTSKVVDYIPFHHRHLNDYSRSKHGDASLPRRDTLLTFYHNLDRWEHYANSIILIKRINKKTIAYSDGNMY